MQQADKGKTDRDVHDDLDRVLLRCNRCLLVAVGVVCLVSTIQGVSRLGIDSPGNEKT